MIIMTNDDRVKVGFREIGEYPTTDQNREEHYIAFVVIREATEEEYLAQCEEYNGDPGILPDGAKFFEIRTD